MNRLKLIAEGILKRHGFFSIDQIMRATGISRKHCRETLNVFCREGLIKRIQKSPKEQVWSGSLIYSIIYRVIDRKKLAERMLRRQFENTVEDRLWFIIWNKSRNDGSFSLRDLIVLANVKRATARSYLRALRRAGYISLIGNSCSPKAEWQLTGRFSAKRPRLDNSRGTKRGAKSRSI
jgi:DNA-binding IclR family transcriptional regulator